MAVVTMFPRYAFWRGLSVGARVTALFALMAITIVGISAIAWRAVDAGASAAADVYQLSRAVQLQKEADAVYDSLRASVCEAMSQEAAGSSLEGASEARRLDTARLCSDVARSTEFFVEADMATVVTSSGGPADTGKAEPTATATGPDPAAKLSAPAEFNRLLAAMSGQSMLLSTEVFLTARRLEATAAAAKSWIAAAGLLALVCVALLASLIIRR